MLWLTKINMTNNTKITFSMKEIILDWNLKVKTHGSSTEKKKEKNERRQTTLYILNTVVNEVCVRKMAIYFGVAKY